jgi:hypothetical protein
MVTSGHIVTHGRRPAKLVEGPLPLQEDLMHALMTFFAAFLMMPAKLAPEAKAPEQPRTPENLIRMGAGN